LPGHRLRITGNLSQYLQIYWNYALQQHYFSNFAKFCSTSHAISANLLRYSATPLIKGLAR